MTIPANQAPDPLLTVHEASELLGVSVATYWRFVQNGTAPKQIKLGSRSRWPRSEVLEIIERLKAARAA